MSTNHHFVDPVQSHMTKRWLVKLALMAVSFAVMRASFVQDASSGHSRLLKVCARAVRVVEEESGEARKLTKSIKGAKSFIELMSLLNTATESTFFNYFHASAAYHKLARQRRRLSKADGKVVAKLHSRVQELVERDQLDEQGLAIVLWGLAKLLDARPEAIKLIQSLASLIPRQTSSMSSRDLSNCLWAAAQLHDLEPSVRRIVPSILVQISGQGGQMNLQDLSNNLDAMVNLQDSVAEVGPLLAPERNESLLCQAADRLGRLLPELEGKGLYMDMPAVV